MSGCENFANPQVDTQNWYVAGRSRDVKIGRIRSHTMLHRRIALYRDSQGVAHAMDARCPHLGADLGQGCVINDEVQCAFHHWRFDASGACRSSQGRSVRVYPIEERWGLVWLFNGPTPLFPLPEVPDGERYRILIPRIRHIRSHPHLVVGNGLDTHHLEALHGLRLSQTPVWRSEAPYGVTVELEGKPESEWLRRLTGSSNQAIRARFSAVGGNIAWATVTQPVRFHTLFTGQPHEEGGCQTQVLLFLPTTYDLQPLRALALMYTLLHNDHRILERLDFHPGYTEGDATLRAMADAVNRMPVW